MVSSLHINYFLYFNFDFIFNVLSSICYHIWFTKQYALSSRSRPTGQHGVGNFRKLAPIKLQHNDVTTLVHDSQNVQVSWEQFDYGIFRCIPDVPHSIYKHSLKSKRTHRTNQKNLIRFKWILIRIREGHNNTDSNCSYNDCFSIYIRCVRLLVTKRWGQR